MKLGRSTHRMYINNRLHNFHTFPALAVRWPGTAGGASQAHWPVQLNALERE